MLPRLCDWSRDYSAPCSGAFGKALVGGFVVYVYGGVFIVVACLILYSSLRNVLNNVDISVCCYCCVYTHTWAIICVFFVGGGRREC